MPPPRANGATDGEAPTNSNAPKAIPTASKDFRDLVHRSSERYLTDNSIPSTRATACPIAVKSTPAAATTTAIVNHPAAQPVRHRTGRDEVRAPSTATAP